MNNVRQQRDRQDDVHMHMLHAMACEDRIEVEKMKAELHRLAAQINKAKMDGDNDLARELRIKGRALYERHAEARQRQRRHASSLAINSKFDFSPNAAAQRLIYLFRGPA